MEISIGTVYSVKPNEAATKEAPLIKLPYRDARERRKRRQDRRKGVRDGIIVSLSLKEDRRTNRDRRRIGGG